MFYGKMKRFTPFVSKLLLSILNLVTASGGAVLIGFGVKYMEAEQNGARIFGDFSFGALSITAGAISLTVPILGCVGACCEKSKLLTIYTGITMGLFTVQLSLGIMAISKIQNSDTFFNEVHRIVGYLFEDDKQQFYILQQEFQCCGVNHYSEYDQSYPASCCENQANPCLTPFTNGCVSAFRNATEDYIEIVGYVAIVFAVVELIAALFAFGIRKNVQTIQYTDLGEC